MAKAVLDLKRMSYRALEVHLTDCLWTASFEERVGCTPADRRRAVLQAQAAWTELRLRGQQLFLDIR